MTWVLNQKYGVDNTPEMDGLYIMEIPELKMDDLGGKPGKPPIFGKTHMIIDPSGIFRQKFHYQLSVLDLLVERGIL